MLVPPVSFPIIAASNPGASAVMSASEITEPRRISLTLDPGLVLERLILRRLTGLNRRRTQDWLRSLLVQGFLVEGQWIRSEHPRSSDSVSMQETRIPTSPYAHWLARSHAPARREVDRAPTPASPAVTPIAPTKPFAHLRKVIG